MSNKYSDHQTEGVSLRDTSREPEQVLNESVVSEVEVEEEASSPGNDILWGLIWIGIGIALTLATGGYLFFYGALIYGAFRVLWGIGKGFLGLMARDPQTTRATAPRSETDLGRPDR